MFPTPIYLEDDQTGMNVVYIFNLYFDRDAPQENFSVYIHYTLNSLHRLVIVSFFVNVCNLVVIFMLHVTYSLFY